MNKHSGIHKLLTLVLLGAFTFSNAIPYRQVIVLEG
ncbi:PhrA family quorum-sensing system peptide [Streptococcus sp. E29BA]